MFLRTTVAAGLLMTLIFSGLSPVQAEPDPEEIHRTEHCEMGICVEFVVWKHYPAMFEQTFKEVVPTTNWDARIGEYVEEIYVPPFTNPFTFEVLCLETYSRNTCPEDAVTIRYFEDVNGMADWGHVTVSIYEVTMHPCVGTGCQTQAPGPYPSIKTWSVE